MYRHGMLFGIVALWSYTLWSWRTSTLQVRSWEATLVVIVTMLLVNQVISSFLSLGQGRRPVQLLFTAACLLFVFRRHF
jgi:hypothetical protein